MKYLITVFLVLVCMQLALGKDADTCFKGEIDLLVKLRKDYRLQEKECSGLNNKNACDMTLYQNLVAFFTSSDRMQCFNTVFWPSSNEPVVPEETPVVNASSEEEPTGPADRCFKGEIDHLVKFREDYRLQEKKCSELNNRNDAQACGMTLYQSLIAHFISADRMQCFNTVFWPTGK